MATGKTFIILCISFFSLLFTSCGTIHSKKEFRALRVFNEDIECNYQTPHIYSGVVTDLQVLTYPFNGCNAGGESGMVAILVWPVFIPLSIIDLPLSATADTIILPYTIYRQIKLHDDKKSEQPPDKPKISRPVLVPRSTLKPMNDNTLDTQQNDITSE